MVRASKRVWDAVVALGTLVGIVYIPADLFGLVETYPWLGRVAAMFDRFTVLAIFSFFLVLYILWMDLRPWVRQRLGRTKPLSDAEATLAAAEALASGLEGRIRYASRVLEENNPAGLRKWVEKAGTQRSPFMLEIPRAGAHLTAEQARAIRECERRFADVDNCVGEIVAGRSYQSDAHAAGLYRDRAIRLRDALLALTGALRGPA